MRRLDARGAPANQIADRVRRTRPTSSLPVTEVAPLVDLVRRRGDAGLRELGKRFDGVAPPALLLDRADFRGSLRRLAPGLRSALDTAARNIVRFHRRQRPSSGYSVPIGSGRSRAGQRLVPLDRVGAYVPKGSAGYPSSVLMTVLPARIAGVGTIVVSTPPNPSTGRPPDVVLAAAALADADEMLVAGGAGAIAALAYGTRSIRPVEKIVGPGNRWVTAAKVLVSQIVAIDGIAGPSEVLLIADDSCSPERLARELLAQAEHDPDAISVACLIGSRPFGEVERTIDRLLPDPANPVRRTLAENGWLVRVDSPVGAAALADALAPEHLVVATARPGRLAARIRNAGAVFFGSGATAPLGDYILGTNHVLPTAGSARFHGALGVPEFLKPVTYARIERAEARSLGAVAGIIAEAEGFRWHREALTQW